MAGLVAVLSRDGPSYRADWIVATAREFGFRRTSGNIDHALDHAIQMLLQAQLIEEHFGRLHLKRAQSDAV